MDASCVFLQGVLCYHLAMGVTDDGGARACAGVRWWDFVPAQWPSLTHQWQDLLTSY